MVAAPRDLRLRPAGSVAGARPGEILVIDRRAKIIGPRRLFAIQVTSWTLLGGAGIALGAFYSALFSPLAGFVASAAYGGYVWLRLRNWPKLRAAMMLAASSRWEEAQVALAALEDKPLPRGSYRELQATLGALEVLLGRPQEALGRLDRLLDRLRDSKSGYAMLTRWRAASVRAGVLARLGRLGEARHQRDELVAAIEAWEARGHSRGEYFDMLIQDVTLAIAFEADAHDELPDTEILYGWARAALARTKFGELLISLAWAFDRRGDLEMSRHLLAESASRIDRPSLATTAPRLHAWAEEQRRLAKD